MRDLYAPYTPMGQVDNLDIELGGVALARWGEQGER